MKGQDLRRGFGNCQWEDCGEAVGAGGTAQGENQREGRQGRQKARKYSQAANRRKEGDTGNKFTVEKVKR